MSQLKRRERIKRLESIADSACTEVEAAMRQQCMGSGVDRQVTRYLAVQAAKDLMELEETLMRLKSQGNN